MATNSKADQPDGQAAENSTAAELLDMEVLRITKLTPLAICRGAMEMMGWYPGKQVTEAEYDAAVAKFRGAPSGKKVR